MKILVCISNVPDTTSKITFTDNNTTFNASGVTYIINPYDEIALARAIELSETNGASVTVINVGEAVTEPTIRKALAIGAGDAVRINAHPRDAYFVAQQIAHFAKSENFDIILTGRESIDFNGSQVAAMLGEMLALPSVSIAKSLKIEGSTVLLEREIEGGKEIVSTTMPFVAGASEGMAEPKIPNMRGIMAARTKALKVIEPIEVSVLSTVQSFETPKPRGTVRLIDANTPEQLIELLHAEAKII
jgi:electron transfer flavoprotein beta subunit